MVGTIDGAAAEASELGGVVSATARLLELANDRRRAAFLARALGGLAEVLPRLGARELEAAAAQPTDYGTLLWVLGRPEALAAWRQTDPLAAARQRALVVKRHLLEAEGGAETASAVAARLGNSRQAVDKRRRAGTLLALGTPQGALYPRWQFVGDRVLPGLDRVLAQLGASGSSAWEQTSWFLSESPRLDDARPLDVLRAPDAARRLGAICAAAAADGEHGAA